MKPSEIVNAMYEEHLKGTVGPRAVEALKTAMVKAAKKSPKKPRGAAAKAAIAVLTEYGKKVPKAIVKLAGGAAVAPAKEEKSGSDKKKPTAKEETSTTEEEAEEASEEASDKVKKLQDRVLSKPAMAIIEPKKMDKVALRHMLKSHGIEYTKEDDEDTLRKKLTTVLKRVSLPVLNINKVQSMEALLKNPVDGCYGILVDTSQEECRICPVTVSCTTQFKANIGDLTWLKLAAGKDEPETEEEEEEEDDEKAAEPAKPAKKGKAVEAEEDEDEEEEEEEEVEDAAEGDDEESEEAEEAEDEEKEDEEKEDDEPAEEEEEEEDDDDDDDDEEDEKGKKAPKLTYDEDAKYRVNSDKNPVSAKEDKTLYAILGAIVAKSGKVISMKTIKKIMSEAAEFDTEKEADEAVADIVMQLLDPEYAILKPLK